MKAKIPNFFSPSEEEDKTNREATEKEEWITAVSLPEKKRYESSQRDKKIASGLDLSLHIFLSLISLCLLDTNSFKKAKALEQQREESERRRNLRLCLKYILDYI